MFGIGVPEMLLVVVVALVVFGPKRLPELARTIGQAMGRFRAVSNSFQQAIEREVHDIEKTSAHPPVEHHTPPDSAGPNAPDEPETPETSPPPEPPKPPSTSG